MSEQLPIPSIDPHELYELSRRRPVDLIDVSTPVEYEEVRVRFAENAPIGCPSLAARIDERRFAADRPLYVICRGGVRSRKVCHRHPDRGLVNVEGGTRLWLDRGLPVARNSRVLSLERQASLAGGALLLAGGALGLMAAPAAFAVSVTMGALMLLSGATDLRALEIALSKMPWNNAVRPPAHVAN